MEREGAREINHSLYQRSAASPGLDWFSELCSVTSPDLSPAASLCFCFLTQTQWDWAWHMREATMGGNRQDNLLTSESNTLSPYLWELSSRIPKRVSRVSWRNCGREQNKGEFVRVSWGIKLTSLFEHPHALSLNLKNSRSEIKSENNQYDECQACGSNSENLMAGLLWQSLSHRSPSA